MFSIFLNMKVCCVSSLESLQRGDSNENTQHTIINIEKKNIPCFIPNIIMSAEVEFFSKALKNEFETSVVNEPSVFEPLKFYCM